MVKEAGNDIEFFSEYRVNDTITLRGSVDGSFEDWAYAVGWESDSGNVLDECDPFSAPELPEDFFIANFTDVNINDSPTKDIRTAAFRIRTGISDPDEAFYGARDLIKHVESADYAVDKKTVYDTSYD